MSVLQTSLALAPAQAEAVLSSWLGTGVQCLGIQRLHGGMVNSVYRLDFDRQPFSAVIKLTQELNNFQSEARALNYLHAHTRFPCPKVYQVDTTVQLIPYHFLLLEILPGMNMHSAPLSAQDTEDLDRQLAEVLLELHTHTRATYGGVDDPGHVRWLDVFLPRLVEARAQLEIEQRLTKKVLSDVDSAILNAEEALLDQGVPTLIHNDIWAANIMVQQGNGRWHITGLVDPGLQYADVESELAYLEVFNTAHPTFFEAYTRCRPLRPGYAQRRLVYWLHTALVHVWLFGDQHYCEFTAHIAATIRSWG